MIAQRKVTKFINYFCLATFSFNYFEAQLALSFRFFLIGYLLPVTFDKNETSITLEANSETYPGPCQTSKMEVFTNLINGFSFLIVFAKISILDVWQDSEFASEPSNDLQKKLHLRGLAGSSIHLCINHFRKTVAYLFTKFDQHIHHISRNTASCTVKSAWP